jgi:phytanoyl-CoA hydroxylase
MISPEIETFKQEGFLAFEKIFSDAEIQIFAAAYDDCLERLRQEDGLKNIRQGQLDDGTATEVNQIRCAHLFHPAFAALVRDARILDRVETLIGPNLRLILCQGLYKPAHTGGEIGWHQDDYYFRVGKKDAVVSCWMAFGEATVDNGCMWVIPRVHDRLWPHKDAETAGYVMSDPDEEAAIAVPLAAGQMMFHHGATPHRTLSNRTDKPRRALAIHYMDATAPMDSSRENEPPENTPVLRGRS